MVFLYFYEFLKFLPKNVSLPVESHTIALHMIVFAHYTIDYDNF